MSRLGHIAIELARHIPFTALGTAIGGVLLFAVAHLRIPDEVLEDIFYTFHPLHIILSAIATTAMYTKHSEDGAQRTGWILIVLIGYFGTIVPATISDSVIPYISETLLRLPNPEAHIGFMERWWLVNPIAAIGIAMGYWRRETRIPHSMHVLVSTLASLSHMAMALDGSANWIPLLPALLAFLFLAVWVPCCTSDIVFPLLFVKGEGAH
ncbi:MAG: hypothetical protein QXY42_07320 [Candidatus Bathyarchaeia archaeon]